MFRQQASAPIFRGRKLVLNYTGGSPCPSLDNPSSLKQRKLFQDDGRIEDHFDDDDDEEDDDEDDENDEEDEDDEGEDDDGDDYLTPSPSDNPERRKSTIMSFLCDRDPVAPSVTISFVGTPDSCAYFFEVRSPYACGGAAASPDEGLGPAGVFGVMYDLLFPVNPHATSSILNS